MKLLHRLYYAINRWRYGESYGCGRCHHAYIRHYCGVPNSACIVHGCPCREYSIQRVSY